MKLRLGAYSFVGPVKLIDWAPPRTGGIYAVLHNNYPIYFGQCPDFSAEGFPWNHPSAACWISISRSRESLDIAYYEMPDTDETERIVVKDGLARRYRPLCNEE